MISIRKRWLVGASAGIACSQFVFFAISGSSVGSLAYKLMAVSLDLVDQSVMPTLWATKEGWPLPTLFGYLLYAVFSSLIVFLILWGICSLFGLAKKEPIQTSRDSARDVT